MATQMETATESIIKRTRKTRMTPQRKIIYRLLMRENYHPSVDEVYKQVRQVMPRISLGTVYRNLEVLTELGKIRKIEFGGSTMRFDGNLEKHYHIRCINCGRLDDAPMQTLENIEQTLYGSTNFKIMDHRLEFQGLCPDCMEQAAERFNPDDLNNDALSIP